MKKKIKYKKGTDELAEVKGTIYYDGGLEELYSLAKEATTEIDTDKMYDWLLKSEHISFSNEQVKNDVKKKARKRKIDKLNNED